MRRPHERRLLGNASVPDDLAGLFAAERARPDVVSRDVEDRVWGRVGATVGLAPPGSGSDGGGGGSHGSDGGAGGGGRAGGGGEPPPLDASATSTGGMELGSASVSAGGSVAGEAAVTATSGLGASAWLATTSAKIVLGVALSGAAVGGVAIARAPSTPSPSPSAISASSEEDASPRVAPVLVPAPAPEPLARAERPSSEPSTASSVASTAAAPIPSNRGLSPSVPARDDELEAERDLLEKARAALGMGDASAALTRLAEHASRFPRARLGDEREALTLRALVAAGRRDEARARFERFRARSPRSLLLPAMEAALGGM